MELRRICCNAKGSVFALAAIPVLLACSWDYPVWPKSKHSDTPLFRIVVNERYGVGYIDRTGKIVIPPQYFGGLNQGSDFFEGLARVSTPDHKEVYIDATGRPVLSAQSSRDFSEGVAVRWLADQKKAGYINHQGTLVIPAKFDGASDFQEGLAAVSLGGRYGYIDHSGAFTIPAKYVAAESFSDGVALVIERGPCQHIGYGPCAYPLEPPTLLPFGEAKPRGFDPPRCRYSFIDRQGRVLLASRYMDAKRFAEGLAPVGNGKAWGYVDKRGTLRIPLRFEAAEPFAEGLARVRQQHRTGYIDRSGHWAIPPQFTYAEDFSEGVAVVMDEAHQYTYIDKAGRQVIPGKFNAASSFVMGRAHVRVGRTYHSSKWSYIDHSGKPIFTYEYQSPSK